jgi:glycerol-3-phosphate acyltransferase PlsY
MAIVLYITAYLIGNLRFAYLTTYLFNLKSPHAYGSKNPGATNIGRQNKLAGFLTFILDAFKVVLSYSVSLYFSDSTTAAWCGMITTIGHIYPLDGYGGKGVACWLGFLFIMSPQMACFFLVTLLLFHRFVKNLGMGSLVCVSLSMLYPPQALNDIQIMAWYVVCAVILFSHRSNLKALIQSMT